ncbi:ancestral coatomer element 1, Sec16/Sec31 [Artemisia annua]|uniref:Protein transport protein sec16 n=1 Tax=Artemisia annua TaxID=35608 RepID=A0A2U1QNN5_ARTAN|nr:ancestral coatomer element 1, Sec16/Sec31 [Artemisia annua]
MEDTDEDFFDKLVDDVKIIDSVKRNESENVNEVVKVNGDSSVGDSVRNLAKELENLGLEENVAPTQSLVSSSSNVNQQVSSGGGSGVKEVQWSAFSTEDNTDSNVFGAYNDDFFTEFDGNLVEPSAKNENFVARQWYQVDEGYDTTLNAQVSDNVSFASDWTVSGVKTESQDDANLRADNNNFNQQQQSPYDYASQSYTPSMTGQSETMNATNAYVNQDRLNYAQQNVHQSEHQKSYRSNAERSSAGQPRHALVTFGFGGKLIVMKDTQLITQTLPMEASLNKESSGGVISVHNLAEVVAEVAYNGTGVRGYFHILCRQSFPGPLAGGNVGSKELNRWIDERITHPSDTDDKRDQVLKLLLSLLKIASQHYGKLHSPFGTDTTSKENDAPDVAVARLFASAKKSNENTVIMVLSPIACNSYLQKAIAAEVQTLLVSGRKMEALYRAQEGQLWGLAFVLAAQLGDQFYTDTVRQMALRQIVAGSLLRTLCLLIAGQPADVFSTDTIAEDGTAGGINMFQPPAQVWLCFVQLVLISYFLPSSLYCKFIKNVSFEPFIY